MVSGQVVPVFFSDHDLVQFKIRAEGPSLGPGYWHLNTSIPDEVEFRRDFKVFFEGLVGLRCLRGEVLEW